MSYRPMNLFFALLFLVGCFAGPLAVKGQDKPLAMKVNEFMDGMPSRVIVNLEALAHALQSAPSARGFIVVYNPVCALPGTSSRRGLYAKAYLTVSSRIDANRLVVIDGGAALVEATTFELWVVPIGATPQIRKDVVYDNDLTLYYATKKYDEHYWHAENETEDLTYDYSGLKSRLDGFAKVLQQQSELQGYIVGKVFRESACIFKLSLLGGVKFAIKVWSRRDDVKSPPFS